MQTGLIVPGDPESHPFSPGQIGQFSQDSFRFLNKRSGLGHDAGNVVKDSQLGRTLPFRLLGGLELFQESGAVQKKSQAFCGGCQEARPLGGVVARLTGNHGDRAYDLAGNRYRGGHHRSGALGHGRWIGIGMSRIVVGYGR